MDNWIDTINTAHEENKPLQFVLTDAIFRKISVGETQASEIILRDETGRPVMGEDGRPQKLGASGLLARVIQHELDHLNGVLFVDRVKNAIALNKELTAHGFAAKDVQAIK